MDIKVLQTFVVAAKMLNFRKAAELLYMAQPTVTKHIVLLENELRVQLFDRTSRRVRLTAAGDHFLDYANKLLTLYEQGVQELTSWQQGYRERLILAVSPLVARSTLPQAVKQFTTEQPDVEVVIQIALSPEIPLMVAGGRAHLGLSRVPTMSTDLRHSIWYTDPVVLVVPHKADMVVAMPTWKEVLNKNRLLTNNHPIYWDDLLLAIHHHGIHPRTMEISLVDITKQFIEEGMGVSFLPLSTVSVELETGRLIQIPTPGLEMPTAATYIIYPSRGTSIAARKFTEVVTPTRYPDR